MSFDLTKFEELSKQAKETAKLMKRVGFFGKIEVRLGAYCNLFTKGLNSVVECFVPISEKNPTFEACVEAAEEKAASITKRPKSDFNGIIAIALYPMLDKAGKPVDQIAGNMASARAFDIGADRNEGQFVMESLTSALNKAGIKTMEFWCTIQYIRLPDAYGGNTSVKYDNENESLVPLVIPFKTKKEAEAVHSDLIENRVTREQLVSATGHERGFGKGEEAEGEGGVPNYPVESIGEKTAAMFSNVAGLYNENQVKFFKDQRSDGLSVDDIAGQLGIDPGDIAILLNDKSYFEAKMKETGKGEQESLVIVAKDTGTPAVEIAKFLDLKEVAF